MRCTHRDTTFSCGCAPGVYRCDRCGARLTWEQVRESLRHTVNSLLLDHSRLVSELGEMQIVREGE